MSFQSLPRAQKTTIPLCAASYTEYDGREGAFTATCSRPKGHNGYHGWGSPSEIRHAEAIKRWQDGKGPYPA